MSFGESSKNSSCHRYIKIQSELPIRPKYLHRLLVKRINKLLDNNYKSHTRPICPSSFRDRFFKF